MSYLNTGINTNDQNTSKTSSDLFSKEAQNKSISQNGFSINAFPKRVEVGRVGFIPKLVCIRTTSIFQELATRGEI